MTNKKNPERVNKDIMLRVRVTAEEREKFTVMAKEKARTVISVTPHDSTRIYLYAHHTNFCGNYIFNRHIHYSTAFSIILPTMSGTNEKNPV